MHTVAFYPYLSGFRNASTVFFLSVLSSLHLPTSYQTPVHSIMAADSLSGVPRDSLSPSTISTSATCAPKPSTSSISLKRKPTSEPTYFTRPRIFRSSFRPIKQAYLQIDTSNMELHHSTCLNLNTSDNSDSDLWILPDFEDWEYDDVSPLTHPRDKKARTNMKVEEDPKSAISGPIEWIPFVQRAASSNRERLRRRLEGDGWDFVGGKYGYANEAEEWRSTGCGSEESVDEEFDVVVLAITNRGIRA
jgi:hypothetical protein